MKNLHKADRGLFLFVKGAMSRGAERYHLPLKSVSPMPKKRCVYYGECDHEAGGIWIRVRKAVKGRWAKQPDYPYQIADTMAHELAHLKYHKHDLRWFRLYASILLDMSNDLTFFPKLRAMFKERKNT